MEVTYCGDEACVAIVALKEVVDCVVESARAVVGRRPGPRLPERIRQRPIGCTARTPTAALECMTTERRPIIIIKSRRKNKRGGVVPKTGRNSVAFHNVIMKNVPA